MKTLTTLSLIGASVLALSAGAASAQSYDRRDHDGRYDSRYETRHDQGGRGWMNINQRQAELDRRIDRGVQRGDLTRFEARRLHNEFNQIARLEQRYRVNGLNAWERQDLDRRFDRLSAQIRYERRDNDQYGYGYGGRR